MLPKLLIRLRFTLVCAFALLATASSAQNTIYVGPGRTHATIQSGMDAAGIGDTVLVDPGTYYEHIDFNGKAITVTSAAGPATTIIDGGTTDRAVSFKSGETRSAILSGFSIQRGGTYGLFSYVPIAARYGAVYVSDSSPTIRNNILTQNACWAIYSERAAPLIEGNTISATQDKGYCNFATGSAVYIAGNLHNSGVTNDGSAALVTGNTIENNTDAGYTATGDDGGAAVYINRGSPVIMNNVIRNNADPEGTGTAVSAAGGAFGVAIVQNIIYNNSSACGGGALGLGLNPDSRTGIAALVANNTLIDNTYSGGANGSNCSPIAQIYPDPVAYGGFVVPNEYLFINNIIAGSTRYPAVNCGELSTPSESIQPSFQNNMVYNATGPFFGNHCVDVSGKYNNIAADPLFVGQSSANFQLTSGSPAIDAGENDVLTLFHILTGLTLTTDIAGHPRLQGVHGQVCTIDMGAYEYTGSGACGTSETMTSSVNPSSYNQSITFNVALSATSGTPTGSVQFSDGSTILDTDVVSTNGVASYTTSILSAGSHNITATYQPSGTFSSSSASLTQVVSGISTTSSLACSTTAVPVGTAAPLTVNVISPNGTPAGTIVFTDNGSTVATQPLTNGTAYLSYAPVIAGTHTLTATFQPTGIFAASSATCTETVTALPSVSNLTVAPTSATFGSTVTLTMTVSPANPPGRGAPSGPINFLNGSKTIGTGNLINGVATLIISSLFSGKNELSCTYPGGETYASSTCNAVPVTITSAASVTTLSARPNPAYLGQTVTLTATVAAPGAAAGIINFYDGSSLLGSANLTSGNITLPLSTLAAGTHSLTAAFASASANLLPSTSAVLMETILPSGFNVSLLPSTVTVAANSTATTVATVTPIGAFSGPLPFSYSALPLYSTASFTPSVTTLAAGGKAVSTFALVTHTTITTHAQSRPPVLIAVALLFPLGLVRRRRAVRLLVLAVFATSITGCTNLYYSLNHTPAGTYTIPVTATDAYGVGHSATFTVVVTP